ncbi:hypothetical protein H632_c4252p0, partial [Helicosporidium sp. ATCC 50920]
LRPTPTRPGLSLDGRPAAQRVREPGHARTAPPGRRGHRRHPRAPFPGTASSRPRRVGRAVPPARPGQIYSRRLVLCAAGLVLRALHAASAGAAGGLFRGRAFELAVCLALAAKSTLEPGVRGRPAPPDGPLPLLYRGGGLEGRSGSGQHFGVCSQGRKGGGGCRLLQCCRSRLVVGLRLSVPSRRHHPDQRARGGGRPAARQGCQARLRGPGGSSEPLPGGAQGRFGASVWASVAGRRFRGAAFCAAAVLGSGHAVGRAHVRGPGGALGPGVRPGDR